MKLSVVSFTERGMQLSLRLAERMQTEQLQLYTKCSQGKSSGDHGKIQSITERLADWTGTQMREKNGLIFIGACGIAVRAIAPFILDKRSDSPVLVMDETGAYVIPILSGHLGGANELARQVEALLGATAVITTATDLNGSLAIDLFAKKNRLSVVNKDGIAKVSAKVLAGERITMSVASGHLAAGTRIPEEVVLIPYPPAAPVDVLITEEKPAAGSAKLWLCPKAYAIGMGCKRGKEPQPVAEFIAEKLGEAGLAKECVAALASIDRKKDEACFLDWSRKGNIPFLTYTAKELNAVTGSFHASDFVQEQVGVDNVCERAALRACQEDAVLVLPKCARDGMTIAIAGREWSVSFEE